jgi:cellulose synthase/poly-beta-1,6-N-acetylglucosamine synthase-like glycosyltransferase
VEARGGEEAGRRRGRPARPGEGRRRKVGDAPDRWAPPVGERVREGGEVGWRCLLGREGRWAGGLLQMRAEKNKKKKERSLAAGGREGRECLIFFFFFQILFKSFSNLFKFKSFTSFQIQILTQISPTILRTFHKPFLTTFQTYFKFKPSFFLIQTFTQIFTIFFTIILRTFHKYFFRTFKTTPQPKLMHFNMMHKYLFDSNY